MNTYIDSKKNGLKAKLTGIEFKISLLKVIVYTVFGIVLLIWSFFIGILVGRGDNPENMVPEIAAIMPTQNTTNLTSTNNNSSNVASQNNIIQPENLEFMDNLKTEPSTDDLTNAPLATNIPPKSKKVRPQPIETQYQQSSIERKKETKQKPAQRSQSKAQVTSGEGVFDYVYQVAASRNKDGAENLKKKLVANGLSASIVQTDKDGSILYRINIAFRGTPTETRGLNRNLKDVGLDRKILISKVPSKE